MNNEIGRSPTILVVDDVEETRDGIEQLLRRDGYEIDTARDEQDAIEKAQRKRPHLILVSLGGPPGSVIESGGRIRTQAGLSEDVPVVIFCVEELGQGDEVAIGRNVHISRPDNFNQLRGFIADILHKPPPAAQGRTRSGIRQEGHHTPL